jgi:hypothetical protein
MDIPPHTRAYVENCIDEDLPVDRARIAAETGLPAAYALSVICAVVSERHGIASGPPWREQLARVVDLRKRPKERTGLLACTCGGSVEHSGKCPVNARERWRRKRAASG